MTPISLTALAPAWLEERGAEKPSPHTEAARRSDLAAIGRLLADGLGRPAPANGDDAPYLRELGRLEPADVTTSALQRALAAFARRDHAAASVRRALSTWRGFCRWLATAGHLPSDPSVGIKGPKRPEPRPKPLELTELARVVTAACSTDDRARRPWPERDRALVTVFAGAGLRIGEVTALRVGDLEATDRSPRIRVASGKGGYARVVPIGPEVVDAVAAYLATREARVGRHRSTDPMFVRGDGHAFTRQTLDYLVLRWFRRAGVAPPPGSLAHALRHTYATLLVDTGASLPEVQQLLGHRSLSSTQVYLGVTGRGLEEAALSNPARRLLSLTDVDRGS